MLTKTNQKRVTKGNDFLLKTFKTTAELNQSLKKPKKVVESKYLQAGKRAIELLEAHLLLEKPDKAQLEEEKIYLAKAEVKNLDNFSRAAPNEKIAKMIREQRDRRRERHFQIWNDYEKVIDNLFKSLDESYKEIQEDVTIFFAQSDKGINKFFDSYTDDVLLKLDKKFIDDLRKYINDNKVSREDRIQNLLSRLNDIEFERESTVDGILKRIKLAMIETAYILEPEVNALIQTEAQKYEDLLGVKRAANQVYVDEVNNIQKTTFEKFEIMAVQSEKRWRRLKHDEALQIFKKEMTKTIYTNPPERNALYGKLKIDQLAVFNKRKQFMKDLDDLSAEIVSKSYFEKMLDNVKQLNDDAQTIYDRRFDELKVQHESLESTLIKIREVLREKLVGFAADLELEETLEIVINRECQPLIDEILNRDKNILLQAMSVIEENDLRANELLTNINNFYMKLGTSSDDQIVACHLPKKLKQFKFDYDLEKAKLADDNDDKLDVLNEELENEKKNIREAVHHLKLDEFLQRAFVKLDEIEKEYRDFHQKNESLVAKHPQMIESFYSNCEKEVIAKFEIVDETKKAEIEAIYQKEAERKIEEILKKEELEREEAEKKAVEDKGNKKGGAPPKPVKKDPKKAQKELDDRKAQLIQEIQPRKIQEYTSPFGVKWYFRLTQEEFVKEFFSIKDEDEPSVPPVAENPMKIPIEEKVVIPDSKDTKKDDKNKAPAAKGKKEEVKEEPKVEEVKVPEKKVEYFVDWVITSPTDLDGKKLLSEDVYFSFESVKNVVFNFLSRLLFNLKNKKDDLLRDAEQQDKEFEEASIMILDQRLKAHYPLKGKLETEIFAIRSSEITDHKIRYERHVRKNLDKLDNQTERFNMILEETMEAIKKYETEQKALRESLPLAENLSRMQGIQNAAKEHTLKFGENARDVIESLQLLSLRDKKGSEIEALFKANDNFIRDLKFNFEDMVKEIDNNPHVDINEKIRLKEALKEKKKVFEKNGFYSDEEIAWYREMMNSIDSKYAQEAVEREKRLKEIEKIMNDKRAECVKSFEEKYVISIEDLSAKDGTGKKYGKPKRIAQEKLRFEMTKCEKSQECIENLIKQLHKSYEQYSSARPEEFMNFQPSFSLKIRKILMSLRSCITRYSIHIEAIKSTTPVTDMPRVSYNEEKFDLALDEKELEEDNKRKEEELEILGPLFYQKEPKKFKEWITDIETLVKAEAVKLYDKKPALLTGADKIPDYLRAYFEGMRKSTEEFRIGCCRQLRDYLLEISEMSEKINEMVFGSIKIRYFTKLSFDNYNSNRSFDDLSHQMEHIKEENTFHLRPNLANPACEEEFKILNEKEAERLKKYLQDIEQTRSLLNQNTEKASINFFKCLLNNYEFLLIYYDKLYLFEDFNKLPGGSDEDIQKKHAGLKALIKTKKTGVVVDRSTERYIQKKWPVYPLNTFLIDKTKTPDGEVPKENAGVPNPKDPKAKDAKPPAKDPKKKDPKDQAGPQQLEAFVVNWSGPSKELTSFKTFRHKSCYHLVDKIYADFKEVFEQEINKTLQKYDAMRERELKYQFQWERSIEEIFHRG